MVSGEGEFQLKYTNKVPVQLQSRLLVSGFPGIRFAGSLKNYRRDQRCKGEVSNDQLALCDFVAYQILYYHPFYLIEIFLLKSPETSTFLVVGRDWLLDCI
jgi:hypothetical protein